MPAIVGRWCLLMRSRLSNETLLSIECVGWCRCRGADTHTHMVIIYIYISPLATPPSRYLHQMHTVHTNIELHGRKGGAHVPAEIE